MDLHGIFPPVTTPFDDRDEVDYRAFAQNVQHWMTTQLHGLVVLGSNGEAPYIDDDEAYRLVATAREHVPGNRRLIVGAGHESTRRTIAAVGRAAQAGADLVLVRTPSYFKSQMTADVFIRHYTAVADASRVPVLLYDVPAFTGVTLPVAAVATLAEHPNIIGAKESAPDIGLVSDFVAATPRQPDPPGHRSPRHVADLARRDPRGGAGARVRVALRRARARARAAGVARGLERESFERNVQRTGAIPEKPEQPFQ